MGTNRELQIAQPTTFMCGLSLPNRLVKAALTEELADGNLLPNDKICALYRQWAEGNWGMVLTGTSQFPYDII